MYVFIKAIRKIVSKLSLLPRNIDLSGIQNNPKTQEPSYKLDVKFLDCLIIKTI